MGPNVSVIVCTLNRAESLKFTLKSLLTQTFPQESYEIIVVDNGSTDTTRSAVDGFQRNSPVSLSYVYEPEPGLSVARNRGIRSAKGEIIAFIDDDAQAGPAWLAGLMKTFGDFKNAVAVGGRVEAANPADLPAWVHKRLFIPMLALLDFGSEPIPLKYPRCPAGVNVAFRKAIFERVGLFDPNLGRKGVGSFRGGEEVDLFLRIDRSGGIIYYSPSAVVYHHLSPERLRPDWFYRNAYSIGAMKALLEKKALSPFSMAWNVSGSVPILIGGMMAWIGALALRRKNLEVLARCVIQNRLGYIGGIFGHGQS